MLTCCQYHMLSCTMCSVCVCNPLQVADDTAGGSVWDTCTAAAAGAEQGSSDGCQEPVKKEEARCVPLLLGACEGGWQCLRPHRAWQSGPWFSGRSATAAAQQAPGISMAVPLHSNLLPGHTRLAGLITLLPSILVEVQCLHSHVTSLVLAPVK